MLKKLRRRGHTLPKTEVNYEINESSHFLLIWNICSMILKVHDIDFALLHKYLLWTLSGSKKNTDWGGIAVML